MILLNIFNSRSEVLKVPMEHRSVGKLRARVFHFNGHFYTSTSLSTGLLNVRA